jgi:predicted permease
MLKLLRRLRYWWKRDRLARELREEIEAHRALSQAALELEGIDAEDAAIESRRRLGNVTLASEVSRDTWGWPAADSLAQDLSYALRQLRRQPGFAALAVCTLALGIGLNTTVFTIYSALALRPWPVADPQRVITIFSRSQRDVRQRGGGAPGGFSLDEARYFAAHARTLAGVVTMRSGGGNQRLADDDAAISWVGGSYFDVLRVPMAAGRGFSPADDRVENPSAVAVLSYGYWMRAYGADAAVIGRQVRFEGVPFTIVGVTAREFTGTSPARVDVWMPMGSAGLLRPNDRWVLNVLDKPENCCVSIAARLASGASREDAAAELTLLDARFRAERAIAALGDGVRVLGTAFIGPGRRDDGGAFMAMFAGVVTVLLLACANVGNLLVARGFVRRREIAVRLALGASRVRVVRQLLTEALVLAVIAAAAGLWLTMWVPRVFVSVASPTAGLDLSADRTVLAFAMLTTLVSCALFALAPAIQSTRAEVAGALKDGTQGISLRFRLRGLLLGLQVATVVVLLSSAGLLFRAVSVVSARDFGYGLQRLSFASIDAPARGYEPGRVAALSSALSQALDARTIALVSTPPMGSGNIKGTYRVGESGDEFNNSVYDVSPSYFDVAGVPIVAGRALDARDAGRPAIVISESLARRHWTVATAVGRRVLSAPPANGWNMPGELEVVGVARDAYMTGFEAVDDTIYQPLSGRSLPHALFASTDRAAVESVTSAVARLDPRLRVRVRALSENLDERLQRSKTAALLASLLGGIAIALATVGLFGVFAFSVQQRTREIGIRMALGARGLDVIRLIVASSGVPLAGGLLLGAAASLNATRFLAGYLIGISPLDPVACAMVVLLLASACAVAIYAPARRATRIDPLAALRHE